MMDEYSVASNLAAGMMATLLNTDLDLLTCLTEIRRLVMLEIDAELERWSNALDMNDE